MPRPAAIAGLAIFLAQVSFNVGAAVSKGLFAQVGPEGVAALRTVIAALILLAVARPWRRRISWTQGRWLVPYGLSLGGMNLLIYWAIERVPIGIAVAVEICGPLLLVLLSSRSMRDFVWLGLALAGLALLTPWSGASAGLDPLGLIFAAGAGACWALYILFGKQTAGIDSASAVGIGMVVGSLVTVPFGVAQAGGALLTPMVLMVGLGVAMLSNVLPYMLEIKALGRLSPRVFGLITSCAPAVAALVGFVMLNEALAPAQWLAVGLMMAASAGCSLTSKPVVASAREDAV